MPHDEELETEHTLLDQKAQTENMSSSRCRLPAAVDALAYTLFRAVPDAAKGVACCLSCCRVSERRACSHAARLWPRRRLQLANQSSASASSAGSIALDARPAALRLTQQAKVRYPRRSYDSCRQVTLNYHMTKSSRWSTLCWTKKPKLKTCHLVDVRYQLRSTPWLTQISALSQMPPKVWHAA